MFTACTHQSCALPSKASNNVDTVDAHISNIRKRSNHVAVMTMNDNGASTDVALANGCYCLIIHKSSHLNCYVYKSSRLNCCVSVLVVYIVHACTRITSAWNLIHY
jgi:hypothetical protein